MHVYLAADVIFRQPHKCVIVVMGITHRVRKIGGSVGTLALSNTL